MIELRDWAVRIVESRSKLCYVGELSGTANGDGHDCVRTSPIAAVAGRVVTTRNGSQYLLVGPDRWGGAHWCGPKDAPMNAITKHFQPFYLADGVTAWPPGSTVPPLPPPDET